jgi:hypothetical protein
MQRTSRTLLAMAMLVPLLLLQPVPSVDGAPGLRAAPGGCCASSCACTPAANCGCEVRAPQSERTSEPMAPVASQSLPSPAFVQHPASASATLWAAAPCTAPAPAPEAFKHPGRVLDLVCVLIV